MLSPMESDTDTPVFDTEGYIKRLTDVGMPEAQARIVAEQQARVHKLYHRKKPEDPALPSEE